jgi:O-antigen ligase
MSSAILTTSRLKIPAGSAFPPLPPDSKILYGVFGVLTLAPLAFGAVEPWAIFLLEAASAVLFVRWSRQEFESGQPKFHRNPLFAPMAAFAVIVLVQLVFRMTAYWHDTMSSALLYASYALLMLLASQTLRRSSQVKTLAVWLTAYGGALASFALLQSLSSNGKLYWLRTPRSGGWIYGPYVNHNHYAGLMELLVPIPLVMCQTRFAQGWVRRAGILAAAVMTGTIFLSGSRGGMFALLAELFFLGVLYLRSMKRSPATASFGAFLALAIGLLVWVGGGEITGRLKSIHAETKTELSGGTRLSLNKDSISMARARPVLGWGLGNFPVAYPQFRTFYTDLFVNAAHEDYLQLLVETGIAGFTVMLWFLVVIFRYGLRRVENWTTEISGSVAVACLTGITGILVHSFVDFNLQVPANAAWFYVLCALATSTTPIETRQRIRKVRRHHLENPLPDAPDAELN